MYRELFPARAGRALLRVLTSRGGIVRRLLGAFMLAATVLTVAAAALTTALAGSAQAVSKPPAPGVFGIRLVDIPVEEALNPRAYRYIIDHLNPGITIHRRVQIANLTPSAARITLYPDAATIRGGYFRRRRRPDPQLPDHLDHPEPAQRVPGPACQGHGHRHHPGAADRLPGEPLRRDLGAGNQPRENQQRRQRHRDQPRRHPDLPERRPRRPAAGELRHHLD